MSNFNLTILSPEKEIFKGSVNSIILPTKSGQITVLANHSPLISLLSIGFINIDNGKFTFLIQGGSIRIDENGDTVLLIDNLLDKDIKDNDINENLKRAEEAMKIKEDEIDFAHFESEIERNLFLKKFKNK